MKRRTLLAIGLGAYALALIAAAPAALIDATLARASKGWLRLAEARGTLWSGSGQIEIRDRFGRTAAGRYLAWRALPASLLRGNLLFDVELARSGRRFPVKVTFSGIEVGSADLDLPAEVLWLGVPKLAPLGLGGDMSIHVADLILGNGTIRGNGTLQWRAATSALTAVSPLGDYELRLDSNGTRVQAALRTLRGPVELDGKGSWTSGDNPNFTATARVPPQHQAQLAPLFALIGIDRGEGRFELQLR